VSDFRIMVRHVLPNVVGVLAVQATLYVALAILLESAVSFLGFGIQPPTPSWGNMLTDARATMTTQWWLTVFPGAMIVITALCVNFLGDGLRDALDPKAVE
jgi:peptide/nickel transport system permease protein